MEPEKAGGNAVVALVLGIVGFFFTIAAPVAIWFGWRELQDIKEGRSSPAGKGMAMAGFILGIVGTSFLVLGCVCGGLYALFVLGIIGTAIAVPAIAPAVSNPAPSVEAEMRQIYAAQRAFYQEDLDGDKVRDYARDLDELRMYTSKRWSWTSLPLGYEVDLEGDEQGFAARAIPFQVGKDPAYYIDQTGLLRSTPDGTTPGPDSPVAGERGSNGS